MTHELVDKLKNTIAQTSNKVSEQNNGHPKNMWHSKGQPQHLPFGRSQLSGAVLVPPAAACSLEHCGRWFCCSTRIVMRKINPLQIT